MKVAIKESKREPLVALCRGSAGVPLWHLAEQLLGVTHEPTAHGGTDEGVPGDGVAVRDFVEQPACGGEVVGAQRPGVGGEERRRPARHSHRDRVLAPRGTWRRRSGRVGGEPRGSGCVAGQVRRRGMQP